MKTTLFILGLLISISTNAAVLPNIEDMLSTVSKLEIKFVGRGKVENDASNSCLYKAPGYLIFQQYCRSNSNGKFVDSEAVGYSIYDIVNGYQLDIYASGDSENMHSAGRETYSTDLMPDQELVRDVTRRLKMDVNSPSDISRVEVILAQLKSDLKRLGYGDAKFKRGGAVFGMSVSYMPAIKLLSPDISIQNLSLFRAQNQVVETAKSGQGIYCGLGSEYGLKWPFALYRDSQTGLFVYDRTLQSIQDYNRPIEQPAQFSHLPRGLCQYNAAMKSNLKEELIKGWFEINSEYVIESNLESWMEFLRVMRAKVPLK